jgi:polyvinyl alcohol dehydrogenase (cytochrome)
MVVRRAKAALVTTAAAALVVAATTAAVGAGTTAADWPAYEASPSHDSVTTDTTLTPANVGSLHAAWHFSAAAATQIGQPTPKFDASPTVVGGRVYIGARTGMFYALNATTGAVIWKKQLDFGSNTACAAKGIVATATVQPDPITKVPTVYAAGSHFVYALNAATGAQAWKAAIGPNSALGEARYFNWSSPTVSGGRVFMGLGASCASLQIRGGAVSLNQHTGAHEHSYFDVPAGKVGATVWSSQAVSGANVFVSTGNPDPTGTTIDDAYSIVRLKAASMAKVDKFTVMHGQTDDLDFGSSPTLYTATIGGKSTPLLAACNKDGFLRAWRQADLAAGPVWSDVFGTSTNDPSGSGECISSPAWDAAAHRLFMAGNQTTIGSSTVPGSVRAVVPGTGAYLWEQPLPCEDLGSLATNDQIVAVPMFNCPTGVAPSVKLFNATTGAPLGSVAAAGSVFAQPVLADGELLVADESGMITAYQP